MKSMLLVCLTAAAVAGCGGDCGKDDGLYHDGIYGVEPAHYDAPRVRIPESVDHSCLECHFGDEGEYDPHIPWLHGFAEHWLLAGWPDRYIVVCVNCHNAAGIAACHDCH